MEGEGIRGDEQAEAGIARPGRHATARCSCGGGGGGVVTVRLAFVERVETATHKETPKVQIPFV